MPSLRICALHARRGRVGRSNMPQNRFEHVLTFLKASGIENLATKRDWPKYVQKEPESYSDEELELFFNACYAEEKVYFGSS